jgi:hypothetical protein
VKGKKIIISLSEKMFGAIEAERKERLLKNRQETVIHILGEYFKERGFYDV